MRRSIAAVLIVGAALAVAPRAGHAVGEIGVSRDGLTWAPTLDGPLFDPTLRWVPGGTHTETVWVRNQAADPAYLVIDVVTHDVSGLLASGMISISASADGVTWQSTTSAGTHRLVSDTLLAPGTATEVAFDVALDADASDATESAALQLTVVATLTESAGADRGMPRAGAGSAATTAVLAGTLLVVGALAVRSSRRTRDA
jgi:hypothetical protein